MAAARRGLRHSGRSPDLLKGVRCQASRSFFGGAGEKTTFQYVFLRASSPGPTGQARPDRSRGRNSATRCGPSVPSRVRVLPPGARLSSSSRPGGDLPRGTGEAAASPPAHPSSRSCPRHREPIGLLLLEADVSPPLTKVEFYPRQALFRRSSRVLRRDRPGEVPRKQTVKRVRVRPSASSRRGFVAITQGSALVASDPAAADPASGQVRTRWRSSRARGERPSGGSLPTTKAAELET